MERPEYMALDGQGMEYQRRAQIIGELPLESRSAALQEATASIAARTGLKAVKNIRLGTPAFMAFEGMTRPKAKHCNDADLLLTHGEALSLDLCPSYILSDAASGPASS